MLTNYFVNPWALWLSAGAAAPVIIHLLLRQRPKTVHFPLVRLIRRSQAQTSRRNRLRYLLLLLMRMVLIALFALIIARPVPGGNAREVAEAGQYGEQTTAAVLILDDSMSMRYRFGDVAWFDIARERAQQVLRMLPPGVAVGVLTTSPMSGKLVAELGTAAQQVEEAKPTAGASSCWGALENAAELLRQQFASRNVFLFTDMTSGAWAGIEGREDGEVNMGDNVDVYVVDCATGIVGNGALTELYTAGEPAMVGADLGLRARIISSGGPLQRTVEFQFDGLPVTRQDVKLGAGEGTTFVFSHVLGKPGYHWGRVSFLNPDGLAMDDARTFTVDVSADVRVLVIEDDPASGTDSPSYFLRLVLNPWRQTGRGVFRISRGSPPFLSELDRDPPDVVALCGASRMNDKAWAALDAYVSRGGGLFVFLGPEAGDTYRTEAARALLAAEVREPQQAPPLSPFRLRVASATHPIAMGLKEARADPGQIRLAQFHEMRPESQAEQVLSFGPERPGLLVSQHVGRVAVFAGPADDRWGSMATVDAFAPVCRETALYLANRVVSSVKAYSVGEDVPILYEPSAHATTVFVTPPGAQEPERIEEGKPPGRVIYGRTGLPGHYEVQIERRGQAQPGGFAVNTVASESYLDRVPSEKLQRVVRAGKVECVTDVSGIELEMREAERGLKELTPLLALIALVLMAVETFMANRFYKTPSPSAAEQTEGEAPTPPHA
jgi:hypothetical protein